ncbi:uncharacterized protein LOC121395651 [Xenopus laevis]|uniref:Uncharacterized protein LOC121395651 n=1 Tax=Xenopus laevis TaxID=8355 RepID=A0A8J1L7W7_XENLA|nr:uncharacterized protein LOC121395651 [Xenopus laevis]XP_041425653.1 uncharacterized protein LOC121395651 [Xenopus laevis]
MSEGTSPGVPNTGAATFAYNDVEINRILAEINTDPMLFEDKPLHTNLAKDLLYVQRKETHITLHVSTLAEYIKLRRIPRGLRLDIRPNLCANDKVLQQKWFEICNKCSIDLMVLTVERLTIKLQETRLAIDELKTKALEELGSQKLTEILVEHNHTLSKLRESIKERKRAKFERDASDYRENRVYSWKEERKWQRSQDNQQTGLPASTYRQPRGNQRTTVDLSGRFPEGTLRRQQGPTYTAATSSEDSATSMQASSSSLASSVSFLDPRTATQDSDRKQHHNKGSRGGRGRYPKRTRKQTRF